MRKIISIIVVIIISYSQTIAQSKGITPLHSFFQKNADSTIIIEYATDTYDSHYYKILTKTGDTINAFKYNAIQKHTKTIIPKKLSMKISLEKFKYFNAAADINPYFNIVGLGQDTLATLWGTSQKPNIWNIIDDKYYKPCPDGIKFSAIIDAGGIIIHLITKEKIKTLYYDAPLHFEKQCPGNINRIAAIKLYEIFERYLKH